MNKTKYFLLATALLLAACGNPEKSAQNTMDKVQAELQKAQSDLNPQKRLDAYEQMIKDVEAVAKKTKTSVGRTIANGGSVDGVSLAKLQRLHDALAPRAKCYESPTIECLTPFGSGATDRTSQNSPQSTSAVAQSLVCDKGFSAADKALDPIKINKDAYAKELIQVGFAASKCGKPDEVKAAINAYVKNDPAQGSRRVGDLLSVLGTKDLSAAHPMIIAELENGLKSGAISGQAAANVTLTLALGYAQNGDAKAAMEKYTYFTDTLHYQADQMTLEKLSVNLMADGDVDDGIKLTQYAENQDVLAPRLHEAAGALAARMGLVDDSISASPVFNFVDPVTGAQAPVDIKSYFAPVDAKMKAQYETGANAIEAAIDKLAATAHPTGQTVGDVGLDAGYGLLALVHQKLGEPDKAIALIKKDADYRTRQLGPNAGVSESFAEHRILIALAQGDPVTAAHYIAAANLTYDAYSHMLMTEVGRTKNAEDAISIANIISRQKDLWHCYTEMIPAMAEAGKSGEVDKLIAAWSGDPRQKPDFYWNVIDGMIASGDANGAKSYAQKHDLVKDDRGKMSLDARLMSSDKIAKNRSKAEPIIREMLAIGEADDQAANAKGDNSMYARGKSYHAQPAANEAFRDGYVDLGLELYQKATNKDHRPLLHAFSDKISKSDMTKVLMLAQDNATSPQYLSNVIDAAIRHLQKTS